MSSSPDYSAVGARRVLPSRFPRDGGGLDRLDKALTAPWVRIALPLAVEVVLSIPGCFFGMPAFLVAGPLLAAAVVDRGGGAVAPALVALAALVAVWLCGVVAERRAAMRLVYAPYVMAAAPVAGVGLAARFASPSAAAAANYFALLWLLVMVPVVGVKRLARRRRPIADGAGPERKLRRIGASLRASDPNASFPSGDVAGAAAFACAIFPGAPAVAAAAVALSAFGRVYWRAHHALDVAAGLGFTMVVHAALGAVAGLSPRSCAARAPLAAELVVLPALKALSTWSRGAHVKAR